MNSSASDVEELRLRISQLEQLVLTCSNDSSGLRNSSLSTTINSSLNNQGLIDRVNTLESLLAASELDNSNLRNEIEMLKAEQKLKKVEAIAIIGDKNKEIRRLESDLDLCHKKADVISRKLESMQTYINTLPSNEELASANAKVSCLESGIEELTSKLKRYEARNERLQEELFHKETICQDALSRLEHLRPLEIAREELIKDKGLDALDYTKEEDVKNYVITLKSQIVQMKDLIAAMKTRSESYRDEKMQYVAKINSQAILLQENEENLRSLEKRNEANMTRIRTVEKKLAKAEANSFEYETNYKDLLRTTELRNDQFDTLIKLVTEVELCVSELADSLNVVHQLAMGEEPDLEALLGLVDYQFGAEDCHDEAGDSLGSAESFLKDKHGSLNTEWCLSKWEKIKQSRAQVAQIRKQLHGLYVKSVGEQFDGCTLQ